MGEINVPVQNAGKPSKRKNLSTRVDLTPMVDLGFLLITFFIFTTKMGEPKSMKVNLPVDTPDSSKVEANKTLNIVLGKNDKVWYYSGDELNKITSTDYANGIRKIIIDKKNLIRQAYQGAGKMTVLIKPTPLSSYKNLVDILDEMTINQVSTHVLMDPNAEEIAKVAYQ